MVLGEQAWTGAQGLLGLTEERVEMIHVSLLGSGVDPSHWYTMDGGALLPQSVACSLPGPAWWPHLHV